MIYDYYGGEQRCCEPTSLYLPEDSVDNFWETDLSELIPGCHFVYDLGHEVGWQRLIDQPGERVVLYHDARPVQLGYGVQALTGYPATTFTEGNVLSFGSLIHREDRPGILESMRRAEHDHPVWEVEYRLRSSGSGVRWMRERGRMLYRSGHCVVDGWVQDISNQRHAEESEWVYRRLVAETGMGYLALDERGIVLSCNEPFRAMLELPESQNVRGLSVYTWVQENNREVMARVLLQAVRQRAVRDVDVEIRSQSGQVLMLSLNAASTSDGMATRIHLLVSNVTTRRREQRELTQNRDLLAESQRIAGLGFWVEDVREQPGLFWSTELLEMLELEGVEAQPAESLFLERISPEDRSRFLAFWAKARQEQESCSLEFGLELPSGAKRIVRCFIRFEHIGRLLLRMIGVVQDMTAYRQAEWAVRQSEQRYRALFETSIDGICIMTLDRRIEDANQAFLSIVGFELAELKGRKEQSLTAAPWAEHDEQVAQQLVAQGSVDTYRKAYRHQSGRDIPVRVRQWLVRDEQGMPRHIMAMVRDITELQHVEKERTQLQKAMQQAQKMEAIGHLAGGIAHDFNNILTSMLGYNELAERQVTLLDNPRLLRYVQQIALAGQRARELIRQLLVFSRGGTSQGLIQDISAGVDAAVRMLRPMVPSSMRLRVRKMSDLSPVHMDDVPLQQVLMNLVINARDAQEQRGEIRIELDEVMLEQQHCASCHQQFRGRFVRIAVRDRGKGLDASLLDRIFDPFFTTKPVGKGSGMGLSVVHGIVHEFGGHIQVQQPAHHDPLSPGCVFSILLPCRQAIEQAALPTASVPAQTIPQGKHILVVEDEPQIAAMLVELLEAQGYDAMMRTDPLQALSDLANHHQSIDFLLTDQVMPGMLGADLIQQARRLRPHLPVLMISAQADLLRQQWGEHLDWPVIAKPLNIEDLLAAICSGLVQQQVDHGVQEK